MQLFRLILMISGSFWGTIIPAYLIQTILFQVSISVLYNIFVFINSFILYKKRDYLYIITVSSNVN